jgi:hypothetical protein
MTASATWQALECLLVASPTRIEGLHAVLGRLFVIRGVISADDPSRAIAAAEYSVVQRNEQFLHCAWGPVPDLIINLLASPAV